MAVLYDNIDSLKNYFIVDLNFEYIMIPLFFTLQLWKQGGVQCLKYFLKVLNTTQCVVFHFIPLAAKKRDSSYLVFILRSRVFQRKVPHLYND